MTTPRANGLPHSVIAISLPAELLNQVNQAAAADNRNRSNWIVQAIKERLAANKENVDGQPTA